MNSITLDVSKIVGSDSGLTPSDGDLLFYQIDKNLSLNEKVVIDFQNVSILTSAFLNAAIGQLYIKYDSPTLNSNLTIVNLAEENRPLLIKVVERAKQYFKDKSSLEDSANRNISDD